jgi:hypothetical protein
MVANHKHMTKVNKKQIFQTFIIGSSLHRVPGGDDPAHRFPFTAHPYLPWGPGQAPYSIIWANRRVLKLKPPVKPRRWSRPATIIHDFCHKNKCSISRSKDAATAAPLHIRLDCS